MKRLAVIPADPLYKYVAKGELKPRYWNPGEFFDEIHVVSLCADEVAPEQVQALAGRAKLYIHPVGRPTPMTLAWYYRKVSRLIGNLAPSVIRAHGPWHSGSLGVHAGRRLGVPCLVSIHNEMDATRSFDRRLLLRLVRPLEYYTLRHASAVLCVSNYLHEYASRYGAQRMITVYNKVYPDQFAGQAGSEAAPLQVLAVMRLDPQKDPECLIRAVAPLKLRLKLVGKGELEGRLKRLVRELGVEDRVELIPMVPNSQIHTHYLGADIFAMATHYEGFCIPVLEAMAAGLPVVASQTPPIPEILGGAGLLVEHRPEAFTRAFAELAADPERRSRLGAAARERAASLDGRRMEDREAELYQVLIAKDRAALELLCADARRYVA
ncbi:MAG: glycosyltransferase family 4 protein [Candidatus Handelsmanbacteria bacterium]|nr:glycosyltransferase family 4 protein [Candidatus Handelsmanbacteria bacterium]